VRLDYSKSSTLHAEHHDPNDLPITATTASAVEHLLLAADRSRADPGMRRLPSEATKRLPRSPELTIFGRTKTRLLLAV